MANIPSRGNGMQLIARAAHVLRALGDHRSGMTFSELAEAVELPKSTIHRMVHALRAEDLVTAASTGKVRLGPGISRLGAAAGRVQREEIRPHLERLARELGETVDLSVLDGAELRFIDQIAAPHRLRAVSEVGAAFPLHCSANGKALLAALPHTRVAALLPSRLSAFTGNTITSRPELWAELDRVRETGIAFDREEHQHGISAVAMIIRDAFGSLAAVSTPMPTQRFLGREESVAEQVRRVCEAATRDLGG